MMEEFVVPSRCSRDGRHHLGSYDIEAAGILEIASKVGNLIADTDNRAFPGGRDDPFSRPDSIKIFFRVGRKDRLKERLPVVGDNTVPYRIGKVQPPSVIGKILNDSEGVELMFKIPHPPLFP